MRTSLSILALMLVFTALTSTARSQDNDTDHAKLIKTAHFLEENPLDKSAKELRAWGFVWAADTKDVTVIICGTGSPFFEKKGKFSDELMSQYTIAMTAFKLEHPDKASDENAAQLAGVESALKVYSILLAKTPKGKTGSVDALITKRDNGELAAYVAAANCGKK